MSARWKLFSVPKGQWVFFTGKRGLKAHYKSGLGGLRSRSGRGRCFSVLNLKEQGGEKRVGEGPAGSPKKKYSLTIHHNGGILLFMAGKRTPTYDLEAFKAAFSTPQKLAVTGTALRSAAALGFWPRRNCEHDTDDQA